MAPGRYAGSIDEASSAGTPPVLLTSQGRLCQNPGCCSRLTFTLEREARDMGMGDYLLFIKGIYTVQNESSPLGFL